MDVGLLNKHFVEFYHHPENRPSVYFAPGRVNLIGEHTDYNGGFVLPFALQYGTYLLIRPNQENIVRLASLNFDFRAEIELSRLQDRVEKQWVNYPLGVIDQFVKRGTGIRGMDLLYAGDIPDSAGLSSSASIEMVTAFAINEILSAGLGLTDLIKLSRKAENEFVGVNCGIMDQFAVGMGEREHAIFLNCHTLDNKMVPLHLDGHRLVISNTNKKRGLADSKYNERVAECKKAVEVLGPIFDITRLGEISFMQFYKVQDKIEDEVIRKRARHVISENQRVLNSVSCLWKNDLVQFGALMNASHESLRDNYEVTGTELDTLVEEAQNIKGVLGSRMTGAGFGGCTVSLLKEDVVPIFIEHVGKNYSEKTGLKADFYIAEVSEGVRKLS